jgi:hypothetical protein
VHEEALSVTEWKVTEQTSVRADQRQKGKDADSCVTEQNRTEQNRTEQNRTEQNRTEQNSEQKGANGLPQLNVRICSAQNIKANAR